MARWRSGRHAFVAVSLAALLITVSVAAAAGRDGEFTQSYDVVLDEETLIGERVGRVLLQSLTVEERETAKGSRMFFHVTTKNPKKGHDQAVLVILKLVDTDGNVLQMLDRQKIVEEGGTKTLKLRADLQTDAAKPARLELKVEAWDE